jgi:hypothetical protein
MQKLRTTLRPHAKHAAKPLAIMLLALAITHPCHAAPGAELIREKARALCAFLLGNTEHSGAALEIAEPEQISQAPGQPWPTGLGPVWYVPVRIEALGRGHFMFETGPENELHEFALDLPSPLAPREGAQIGSVPNLQQFPVTGKQHPQTASGCVPTAAACLVGYWAAGAIPQWGGPASSQPADILKKATLRLRSKMQMQEIADTSGYTDDDSALSGAFPDDLANALRSDAEEHGAAVSVKLSKFNPMRLREEIQATRPVLVSCVVRLPHKPQLSWGHEIIAVGWQRIENLGYVGVRDNFFPTQNDSTIRWIREEVFGSMITVSQSP